MDISGVEVQDYTLSSLLDYNKSDKKERVFEVSLFAEVLSEMFQRHFALLILRALIEADGESEVCPKLSLSISHDVITF